MENVKGLSQQKIDWAALSAKITEPGKLGEVDKASLGLGSESLSVTEGATPGRTTQVSAPQLEAPAAADTTDLEILAAKLGNGNALNLSEAELKAVSESITATLSETLPKFGDLSLKTGSLFDVYQLMTLMLEVAQKQRDAARDIRLAENEAIKASIINQADMQRAAAWSGMVASFVVCAIQLGAQGYAIGKSAAAYRQQNQVAEGLGVQDAQANLKAVKVEVAEAKADITATHKEGMARLDEIDAMPRGTEKDAAVDAFKEQYGLEFRGSDNLEARIEFQDKIDTQLSAETAKLTSAEMALSSKEALMASNTDYQAAGQDQMRWRTYSDMIGAGGMMLQGVVRGVSDLISANAAEKGAVRQEAEEQLDQIKELFNQGQEVINRVLQLMSAVIQAETQSMRDAIHA